MKYLNAFEQMLVRLVMNHWKWGRGDKFEKCNRIYSDRIVAFFWH